MAQIKEHLAPLLNITSEEICEESDHVHRFSTAYPRKNKYTPEVHIKLVRKVIRDKLFKKTHDTVIEIKSQKIQI